MPTDGNLGREARDGAAGAVDQVAEVRIAGSDWEKEDEIIAGSFAEKSDPDVGMRLAIACAIPASPDSRIRDSGTDVRKEELCTACRREWQVRFAEGKKRAFSM